MQVRDIMTSPAVSVPPTLSVAEAARLMVAHRIGSVVVVAAEDPTRVVGLFTESDLELAEVLVPMTMPAAHATRLMDLWAQSPEQLHEALASIARRTVGEAMRSPAPTVAADAEVWWAMSRMAELEIARMPVVDGERLVGLLARHDLLKALAALDGEGPATREG